jgi:hypothetical protein
VAKEGPSPYTIVDADYIPICGNCALEKNLPLASVWDSYERLIDIPALRLERDQDFPITYLVEFGVPKGFEINRK